jgi:hypothetical protein
MSRDFAVRFVAHAEDDSGGDAVAQKITMKDRGAFPADWLEQKDVGGE